MTADATGKSAMNMAMWRIIPLILTAYLFAYVDRVNVGFAALISLVIVALAMSSMLLVMRRQVRGRVMRPAIPTAGAA